MIRRVVPTKRGWLDITTSIVMAIASLVTAWNTYEAAQWGGAEAEAVGKSTASRFAATRASTSGEQNRLIDILTFTNWLEATSEGDQELADFYQARFRDEFQPAMTAWLQTEPLTNSTAPATPFHMPEYAPEQLQRAEEFEQMALLQSENAAKAGQISRDYIQNTLYVAVSLFITGLSRSFASLTARKVMVGASGLALLAGIVNTLRLPLA